MNIDQFLNDSEPAEFLRAVYRAFLGREAEESALEGCALRLADGVQRIDILREVAASDEAIERAVLREQMEQLSAAELRDAYQRAHYPESINQWLMFNGDRFIQASYNVLLGRAPDASGLAYYRNLLRKGVRKTRIIYQIADSAESRRFKPALPGLKNLLIRERMLRMPLVGTALKTIDLEFLSSANESAREYGAIQADRSVPALPGEWNAAPAMLEGLLRSHLDKHAALLFSSRDFAGQDVDRDAIAVVSVRPMDLTGIANFNRRTFVCGDCAVDFFADFQSHHEISASHCLGDDGEYRYIHIDYLTAAVVKRKYRAIVFVIGNSNHNFPIVKAIDKLRHTRLQSPVYVHIHDAILLNVTRHLVESKGGNYIEVSKELLSKKIGVELAEQEDTICDETLVREGVTGINYILDDFHVDGMLFNSEAAREFFRKDMDAISATDMHVLFHPVFDAYTSKVVEAGPGQHIRIGTFGVPGRDKQTIEVCRAFEAFHAEYPNSSFVLAGFHVREFAAANNLKDGVNGFIIEEPATTQELLDLMRSCDIAIQLRLSNNGESSGVVPQLLSQDVRTVVTRVGAFAAFGDAVRFVESGISSAQLLEVLRDEVSSTVDRSKHREDFVNNHSPKSFMGKLNRIIRKKAQVDVVPTHALFGS
jgi:hypothetical protein